MLERLTIIVALAVSAFAQVPSLVSAQAPEGRLPEFEVAAVKPAAERTLEQKAAFVPRRGPIYFDWPQISILELVMIAYDIDGTRVFVPEALTKKRFDITAKAPEPVTLDQARPMLRSLLAERFHLVVHRETRTLPVYELTVAKGGVKMLDSTLGTPDDARAAPLTEQKEGGPLWIEPGKTQTKSYTRSEDGVTLMAGRKVYMASIEFLLSRRLFGLDTKRILIDKTGLTGTYDFGIQFLDPLFEAVSAPRASKDIPGIFSGVEHYLGLHLDAKNSPVDVIVVDHADLDPGEN